MKPTTRQQRKTPPSRTPSGVIEALSRDSGLYGVAALALTRAKEVRCAAETVPQALPTTWPHLGEPDSALQDDFAQGQTG